MNCKDCGFYNPPSYENKEQLKDFVFDKTKEHLAWDGKNNHIRPKGILEKQAYGSETELGWKGRFILAYCKKTMKPVSCYDECKEMS